MSERLIEEMSGFVLVQLQCRQSTWGKYNAWWAVSQSRCVGRWAFGVGRPALQIGKVGGAARCRGGGMQSDHRQPSRYVAMREGRREEAVRGLLWRGGGSEEYRGVGHKSDEGQRKGRAEAIRLVCSECSARGVHSTAGR